MATIRPKRIQLIGEGRHEEGRAGAIITPGELIMLGSDGRWIPHNDNDAVAVEKCFALEDALQGRTIDDNYAADELVAIGVQGAGDVVFARLAVGEAVVIGDILSSNGDGALKKATGGVGGIGVSLEVNDLSDSEAVDGRVRCRII